MRVGPGRALLLAGLPAFACGSGDGGTPAAPAAGDALSLRLETAHFRIYADAVPDAVLQDVATSLERELPRYQADLQVAANRPFSVRVVQDESAWFAGVQSYFGRRIDTSGYVTGPEELRVLAGSRVARNATHELAHCVSLYANPTIANNPRWLWESVALLYENGEIVDPRTLAYMAAGTAADARRARRRRHGEPARLRGGLHDRRVRRRARRAGGAACGSCRRTATRPPCSACRPRRSWTRGTPSSGSAISSSRAQGAATTMRSRERTTNARSSWATTARVIGEPARDRLELAQQRHLVDAVPAARVGEAVAPQVDPRALRRRHAQPLARDLDLRDPHRDRAARPGGRSDRPRGRALASALRNAPGPVGSRDPSRTGRRPSGVVGQVKLTRRPSNASVASSAGGATHRPVREGEADDAARDRGGQRGDRRRRGCRLALDAQDAGGGHGQRVAAALGAARALQHPARSVPSGIDTRAR